MVSKIIKRTPTKSLRKCHSRRRRKTSSPAKNAAAAASSALIASINKSLHACQRRLIKIFSKLAKIGTPKRHKGFKVLHKVLDQDSDSSHCRALVFNDPLPPLIFPERKTIFLDLDETLVHSQSDPIPERFDFIVRPTIDGEVMNFYVMKRPGVDELLQALSAKFEIVVFTAGLEEYASPLLDRLDRKGLISHRLYRDSCKENDGKFVKDLSELGRDLKRVVIVDDNPNAYALQPENAIPINSFVGDLEDRELGKLVKFFERGDCFDDMRDAVKQYLAEAET